MGWNFGLVHGLQVVNVESQIRYSTSPLNVLRQMFQMRQSTHLFGRGELTVLSPRNPKIFSYLREYEGEVALILNNLSDVTESVHIDLSRFTGYVPLEMFSQTRFPEVRGSRYHFTISPYGYFWFYLRHRAAEKERAEAGGGFEKLFQGITAW